MKKLLCSIFVLLGLATTVAGADVLERIDKDGVFRIGYDPTAAPLSFEGPDGEAQGYSVDLCRRIAVAVKEHLGRDELKIEYVPMGADQRIDAITSGKADIECGASTVTLSRMEDVDFTLKTFVTGGGIISLRSNPTPRLADLSGRTVAVVKGTTTIDALKTYLDESFVDANVVEVPTRDEANRQLLDGTVDAYASDQVVLIGQILSSGDPKQFVLTEDLFSFEPYAFMIPRGEPEFRLVANRALASLYRSGQFKTVYDRWLGRAGVKPPGILVAMYRMEGLPE